MNQTIIEILNGLNLELSKNKDIKKKEGGKVDDITSVEGFNNLTAEDKYTLLTERQQSDKTFFHKVFQKGDASTIKNLVEALPTKLEEALKLQNNSGYTAVDQLENSNLQAVLSAEISAGAKKTILLTKGFSDENILHNAINDGDKDLITEIFTQAQTADCLVDLLNQGNIKKDSAVAYAAKKKNAVFFEKLFELDNTMLKVVFENENQSKKTIFELLKDDKENLTTALQKLASFKDGKIESILQQVNSSGNAVLEVLLDEEKSAIKMQDLVSTFLDKKNTLIDVVLEVYNEDAKKIAELYTQINGDDSVKNHFLSKFTINSGIIKMGQNNLDAANFKDQEFIKDIINKEVNAKVTDVAGKDIADLKTDLEANLASIESLSSYVDDIKSYKTSITSAYEVKLVAVSSCQDNKDDYKDVSVAKACKEELAKATGCEEASNNAVCTKKTALEGVADSYIRSQIKTGADVAKMADHFYASLYIEKFVEFMNQTPTAEFEGSKAYKTAVKPNSGIIYNGDEMEFAGDKNLKSFSGRDNTSSDFEGYCLNPKNGAFYNKKKDNWDTSDEKTKLMGDKEYYLHDVCVNAELEKSNCTVENVKSYFKESTDFCSNNTSYGGDETNAYQAICGDGELAQITALNSFFDA